MRTLRSNPRVTYKDATQADLIAFYGLKPPFSIKAIVFFLDQALVAIGGWKIENGQYVVFSEIKEGVKVEKATVFRCAQVILKMVSEKGCPMYAATHNHKFLGKLGFKPFETVSDNKEFFVWQC